jgi:hypothetical protein
MSVQSTELLFHYAKKCENPVVQGTLLSVSGELISSSHELASQARRYVNLVKQQEALIAILDKTPAKVIPAVSHPVNVSL